jgi:2,4-dienoyl-CoA reductase-like NADH-dependent reductase (Old Yellow Enzyme family)
MSPTNNRNDQYGGSLENRMRFPIMILKAIREAVGPGFPSEFRLNATISKEENIRKYLVIAV